MPVTKTAKRALRVSQRKAVHNTSIIKKMEVAIRLAKKSKSREKLILAISLADRAAKKNVIHKNKAARIKKLLSKLLPKISSKSKPKVKTGKKTSKK